MQPEVFIFGEPDINFDKFLSICQQALGRNIAANIDKSQKKRSKTERFLNCLKSILHPNAKPGMPVELLGHAQFNVIIIAAERDMMDILTCASRMSLVATGTVAPGITLTILSATLAEWRDAIICGASRDSASAVRACYSKLMLSFDNAGLTEVWNDIDRKTAPDRTGFYLEHKR